MSIVQATRCISQQLSLSEGRDNATGASLLDVSESSLESLIANNLMNNFSLAVHRFIGNCFSASSFTLLNDISNTTTQCHYASINSIKDLKYLKI